MSQRGAMRGRPAPAASPSVLRRERREQQADEERGEGRAGGERLHHAQRQRHEEGAACLRQGAVEGVDRGNGAEQPADAARRPVGNRHQAPLRRARRQHGDSSAEMAAKTSGPSGLRPPHAPQGGRAVRARRARHRASTLAATAGKARSGATQATDDGALEEGGRRRLGLRVAPVGPPGDDKLQERDKSSRARGQQSELGALGVCPVAPVVRRGI